jgi:hypothetical protein
MKEWWMSKPRLRRAYLLAAVASVFLVQLIAPDWIAWAYAWGLLCSLAAIVWTYIGSEVELHQHSKGGPEDARVAPHST